MIDNNRLSLNRRVSTSRLLTTQSLMLLPIILVVQAEQSGVCVCLRLSLHSDSNFWTRWALICWFTLTMCRPCSKVKVTGRSSRSYKENFAKVVSMQPYVRIFYCKSGSWASQTWNHPQTDRQTRRRVYKYSGYFCWCYTPTWVYAVERSAIEAINVVLVVQVTVGKGHAVADPRESLG